MGGEGNAFDVDVVNRLFEGDRVDYHVVHAGSKQEKAYSISVPFLPGTTMIEKGSTVKASFVPEAGVIIKR